MNTNKSIFWLGILIFLSGLVLSWYNPQTSLQLSPSSDFIGGLGVIAITVVILAGASVSILALIKTNGKVL